MKLFVTGAAGFIGSNYVRHVLSTTDDTVTIYDALTYAGNPDNIKDLLETGRVSFVHGDICDRDLVRSSMDGSDAVVHFAAESHVDRSIKMPDAFVRTNCDGTNVMCDVARQVGVDRFVHISTDEVYGSIDEGSFRETDAAWPPLAVLRGQGGQRLDRAQLLRHVPTSSAGHPVVESVRAVPVPGKSDPAVHHQSAR